MPAAFTPEERQAISDRMVATARAWLPVIGLKKLSIDALVDDAGISKGAFYSFFDSKEALYAEVLAREAPGVVERVVGHLGDRASPPRVAFERFLRSLMAEYDRNAVLKRLIEHPEELEAVRRRIGKDRLAAKAALGFEPLVSFLARAEASGDMASEPHAGILGVVVSLPHLLLHKGEPGMGHWPVTEDLLIRLIVNGLFPPARQSTATPIEQGDA